MAQLENIEAIEKRLWSAADTLRCHHLTMQRQHHDSRPLTAKDGRAMGQVR